MFKLCVINRFTLVAPLKLRTTVQCLLLATVPKYIISNIVTTTTQTGVTDAKVFSKTWQRLNTSSAKQNFRRMMKRTRLCSCSRQQNMPSYHILRSTNQDRARLDVLEQLDEKNILIVNDWAMKFLLQRYRQSQADWFSKRGISWHISVVYRRLDGVLQWQGFVHIIESCNQESSSVVKIMQDVLGTIKLDNKEISGAYLRQDNAGCYHSSSTILSCPLISASTGVKIHRIDFSDPQGGKGAADRLAATCKSHVRLCINEGNDVTTAHQLKDALLSHGGIDGVRVVAVETIEDLVEDSRKIPTISKLNNFAFHDDSITAWRAYDVGKGKEIVLEKTSAGNCKWKYMLGFYLSVVYWHYFFSFKL